MVTKRRSKGKKKSTSRAYGGLATMSGGSSRHPATRKGGAWVALVLGALVLVNLYVFVWDKKTSIGAIQEKAKNPPPALVPSQPLEPVAAPLPVGSGSAARTGAAPAPIAPPGVVEGKVAKGDTIGKFLKRSGLSAAETNELLRAVTDVFDSRTLRPGQTFRIERGADGRVKAFELVVSKVQTVRVVRGANGELEGKADHSQTKIELKAIGGRIDSSLYASLKSAGENAALVDFFVDVFAYDIDFYNDTHDGDTFRVLVEKEHTVDGAFVRYGKILAAEYQGKAGTFKTFRFGDAYFDDEGQSSEKTFLKTPLKFARVSSGFDRKRMHPVLHTTRAHLGIDYAAPTGTPVWAAASGVIVTRAMSGGAGNLVIIRHDNGLESAYMHLSKFADNQRVGQRVAAKTVIGYVGTTGLSTGPHLHFGVRQNGQYVDPSKLTPIRNKGIASKDSAAFKAELAKLEAQLAGVKIAATI
jgi:murein DD-endopeptidase MepM/ murein hydrolase activator NlpD